MQLMMYITLLNSHVYLCLGGRLIHLKVFLVWKLVMWSTLVSLGQYVHFPSLVHTVLKANFCLVSVAGGNVTVALVSISLRFGNLLYPMSGLSLKIFLSSSVFWIMFQLSLMRGLMGGFLGLN